MPFQVTKQVIFQHRFRYWFGFIIGVIFIQLLSHWQWFTNVIYPKNIYPKLQNFWQITSSTSSSVGDLLYYLLVVITIIVVYKNYKKQALKKTVCLKILPRFLTIIWLYFHINWGFLYHQTPLKDHLKYTKNMSLTNLKSLAEFLTIKTNHIHYKITQNSRQQIKWPQLNELKYSITQQYQTTYQLNHKLLKAKPSLMSKTLSYMGFSGYLNPFTLEAQYNKLLPTYSQVFTISHEMAHQLGYAAESETNYVAYLNCIYHPNTKIQYAGYVAALRYSLSALKELEEGSEFQYLNQLSEGVLKDLEASKQFQENYNTIINNITHWWYDKYLKINQQQDGIESYQGLLFYLVNHYNF